MKLTIRVIPNAKNTEIVERADSSWKIRLAAPATEGKANKELVNFLSKELRVPKTSVEIVKGLNSKTKVVCIDC